MIKKILPAFLVLAILFNAAGYYIVYELNRYLIRKEIFSNLNHGYFSNSLSLITVYNPEADPAFKRMDDREIEYRGNMYDVLKETRTGKTVQFVCIHDKKEDLLISGMKTMHQKKQLVNILQHLVSIALPVISEKDSYQEFQQIFYPLMTERIIKLSAVPISPPPEIF